MHYEVIIFDADETLFDFKKSEKKSLKNTMIELGFEYDESYHLEVYKRINSRLWKDLELGNISQEKLKTERFRRFSEYLNLSIDEVEFAEIYMKHLANASFLYADSIALIESLAQSHKLIIVTNGLTLVQDKRIRKSAIAKYFETIIISEEFGCSKPDAKILEYALKQIKHFNKQSVLIVGDSLTSDIQGGINFGIQTCWYNPNKLENLSHIKPTYEITNLMALKNIL